MAVTGSHRCRKIGVTAAAMTVCLIGLLSNDANASCGDYLHQPDNTTPTNADVSDADTRRPTHSPVPCHGPGCRQTPPKPLTTAPVNTSVRVENPIAQGSTAENAFERSPRVPCCMSRARTDAGHPPRIDRPPRCAR